MDATAHPRSCNLSYMRSLTIAETVRRVVVVVGILLAAVWMTNVYPRAAHAQAIDADDRTAESESGESQKALSETTQRAESEPDTSTGDGEREESTAESSGQTDDAALLREAFQLSKAAESIPQYDAVIDLAKRGLAAAESETNRAYGRRLLSWTYNRRGETYSALRDEVRAMSDFQAAVRLDPTRWQAIHNRGVSFAVQGRYDQARADFDRTIELRPNYANAYFNRGELRSEQADYAGAIEDYNDALRFKPNDSAALNSRGHAHYRLGNYRAAHDDYTAAIRADANNAAAYTNRGDALADLGYWARAATDYRTAIRIDPALGRAYQSAAWLMATCPDERYRNADLAIEAAEKAIELDSDDDYRYQDTLAAAFANAGQFPEAVAVQEKVLEKVPEENAGRYRQRLALYQQGSPYREAAVARRPSAASATGEPQRR